MVVQANHLGRKVHPLSPARVASPKEKGKAHNLKGENEGASGAGQQEWPEKEENPREGNLGCCA